MPLSSDPVKREAQLANLRRGVTVAPVGNQRRVTHGAYAQIAEAQLAGTVSEVYDALSIDVPVQESGGGLPAADAIVVRLLAEALVRRERVADSELRHGIETPDGKVRTIVEFGLRLDSQILRLCEQLGMTPVARAKLGLDLVRARSAGDRLEAHLQRYDVDSREVK